MSKSKSVNVVTSERSYHKEYSCEISNAKF